MSTFPGLGSSTSKASDSDDCKLSPKDRAISTILTAVVGSIVSGVTNGPEVAFFVGWICWLAAVRLVLVSGAGVLVNVLGPLHGRGQAFIPPAERDEELPMTVVGPNGEMRNANANANANSESSTSFAQRAWAPDHETTEVDLAAAAGRNSTNGPAEHISARLRSSFKSVDVGSDISILLSRSGALSSNPRGGVVEINSLTTEPGGEVEDMNGAGDSIGAQPDHLRPGVAKGNLNATDLFESERNRDVTILGSIGWIYTFLYSPIIQVMWVVANWNVAPSALFVVRAIGVGVTALTYTVDTRARYGLAFGKRVGSKKVVPRLMTLYSALVNLLLTVIVVVLLIRSQTVSSVGYRQVAFVLPYVIFSCFWAFASFKILRPRDAGWNGASLKVFWTCQGSFTGSLKEVLAGLFVGAFAGIFVAAPAIGMWQSAKFAQWGEKHGLPSDPNYRHGKSLGEWLKCTEPWKKAPQILP